MGSLQHHACVEEDTHLHPCRCLCGADRPLFAVFAEGDAPQVRFLNLPPIPSFIPSFVNMETPRPVQLRMFEDFFGDGDLDEDPEATSIDAQTVRWAEVAADGEREIEEWDRILSPLREEQS